MPAPGRPPCARWRRDALLEDGGRGRVAGLAALERLQEAIDVGGCRHTDPSGGLDRPLDQAGEDGAGTEFDEGREAVGLERPEGLAPADGEVS